MLLYVYIAYTLNLLNLDTCVVHASTLFLRKPKMFETYLHVGLVVPPFRLLSRTLSVSRYILYYNFLAIPLNFNLYTC